jgi:nitrite reductase (NADH) small subunit
MTLAESPSSVPIAGAPAAWTEICPVERLTPDRGVAALVDGHAIAIFLLSGGELHAVSNVEPFTGASVLSRGLVGELDGVPTVASPLHKQRFDLRSGRCVDVADLAVPTYPVKIVGDRVHVSGVPAQLASGPTRR